MKKRILRLIITFIGVWLGCLIAYVLSMNFGGSVDWFTGVSICAVLLILFLLQEIIYFIRNKGHRD
ncbi:MULTISPECIES: hypothetical protein [Clostridium]|uniref:Uncharacterized protein n=1 Tax=Clostridium innocuum TaxID=1522 RepID=A0A3E2VL41_CLOIN|nr:hypothetical protein [[Clostridium] innocuum]MCQ5276580.1 hypothetical protein [Clostridium sp. DFI.1.208]RHV66595.1 hypothetical protein DXB22_06140 [Clostridiaceae bacterium OM02-2AC]MCC2844233.1 hypothetical protein [[Clostridium] innocuum]MCC2848552.1 hypothetical protein [[Clostridium] innocuum]MCC2852365.1 hypothetical protein [[Clostridium] innocuum]